MGIFEKYIIKKSAGIKVEGSFDPITKNSYLELERYREMSESLGTSLFIKIIQTSSDKLPINLRMSILESLFPNSLVSNNDIRFDKVIEFEIGDYTADLMAINYYAKNNQISEMKTFLPKSVCANFAQHIFNDLRSKYTTPTRESFIEGSIFNKGDKVLHEGIEKIIKTRGCNFVTLTDNRRVWIKDLKMIENKNSGIDSIIEESFQGHQNLDSVLNDIDISTLNEEDTDCLIELIKSYEKHCPEELDESFDYELNEVLSRIERVRAKARFAKTEVKRERSEKIALHHHSTSGVINKRARRLAIERIKEKIAKKPLKNLSISEKERLERRLVGMRGAVNRLALKMVPRVRQIEKDRLSKT